MLSDRFELLDLHPKKLYGFGILSTKAFVLLHGQPSPFGIGCERRGIDAHTVHFRQQGSIVCLVAVSFAYQVYVPAILDIDNTRQQQYGHDQIL